MIVFGLISPHPPIIIPAIGKDEIERVRKTISALEQASIALGASKPDQLIIISPHEGHGIEVPAFYIAPHIPKDIEAQEILVTEHSYQYYFDLGVTIGKRIQAESKRYAIVASGDLSHVLKADGPYGYHQSGPILDQHIVEAVRRHDAQELLDIDPAILEDGAECGLRSILFLLGALTNTDLKPSVLSYEGPFGVGYMVATYQSGKGTTA